MLRVLVCLAFCVASLAQVQLPQRYRDAGVLRWGSDAEGGAPYVYLDPSHPDRGEIGFEVDLAQELGAVLGVRMERVQTQFANLVQAVTRGDCELAMNGLEPTKDRREYVRFTRPYYIFLQQLSVGPGVTNLRTLADCKGRRVGVLGESLSHKLLQERGDVEIVVYESNVLAYQDVVNGRTDASLADLPIARALRPMFPQLVDVGEPFHPFYYAIAMKPDAADLQQAVDDALGLLFANGTLERIYRKWDLWVDDEKRLGNVDVIAASKGQGANELQWGPALGLLGKSALLTFLISVASFVLAVLLGLVIALARLHGPAPLRWCALAYVEVFRGTPILVQMLLLYYGLPEIGLSLAFTPSMKPYEAVIAGILGLALNYAAYEAEVYRGALSAIARSQREAAFALGMTGAQTMRYVVVPQALRLSLAPSTNDFIALFKDSSIVMVITVVELTKQYSMLAQVSGRFIALGFVTSGLYLAMSLPLAYAARRFERRLDRDHA